MQSNDFIKVALEIDDKTDLINLKISDPLETVLSEICQQNNKNNENKKYGLLCKHDRDRNPNLHGKYITEDNFHEIKDGNIISLVCSIQYMLEWIFISSSGDAETLREKLQYLPKLCNDLGVLKEMTKRSYQNKLPLIIIHHSLSVDDNLHTCLVALKIMLKNKVKPTTINHEFYQYLIKILKDERSAIKTVSESLQIINEIFNNNYDCTYITNLLKIDDIMPYFWREDLQIQLEIIRIFNNIIRVLGNHNKDIFIGELKNSHNKSFIFKHVTGNAAKSEELSHELCIYQSHILSSYKVFLKEEINQHNDYSDILDLQNQNNASRRDTMVDFEEKEIRSRLNTYTSDSSVEDILNYSRLSSTDSQIDSISVRSKTMSIAPYMQLEPVFISKLTSMCIEFYKNTYKKNYSQSFSEIKYEPGFYKVCDQITHILCDILYISNPPEDDSKLFIPLVFRVNESFFEEIFCRAVWIIAKTRREMHARVKEDHQKVLNVVKEQLFIALDLRPKQLKEFTEKLKKITHVDVFNKWDQERNNKWENFIETSSYLNDLRNSITPEINELITEQRLETLFRGNFFPKLPEKRGKQLYWFIALKRGNKKLEYGDYDPDTLQYTSQKTELSIKNITHVTVGKASPIFKENKIRRAELASRCFSILLENGSSLDFLAPNDLVAQNWIDGFHLLINKPATSESYKKDFDILITMELNLRLLELPGIPDNPPAIPPSPVEYRPKPELPPKSDELRQSIIRRRTLQNSISQ